MARHLAPFSCRQRMAESVRRRSWGGVLPLGRHASISGCSLIHCASVSIAPSLFQERQNARHQNWFKREQTLKRNRLVCWGDGSCEAELCDLACEAAGLGFGRGAILSRQAEAVMLERDVDGRS